MTGFSGFLLGMCLTLIIIVIVANTVPVTCPAPVARSPAS